MKDHIDLRLQISHALHKRLKAQCVHHGQQAHIIRRALDEYLKQLEHPPVVNEWPYHERQHETD